LQSQNVVKSFCAVQKRKFQSNLIHGVYAQLVTDVKLGGDTNHETRPQKRITIREYLYVAGWLKRFRRSSTSSALMSIFK